MLAFGLVVEYVWYRFFSRQRPIVQRRSAQLFQFLRALVVAAVIYRTWRDLIEPPAVVQICYAQCVILLVITLLGMFSLSPRWDRQERNWQERVPSAGRYLHRIPYDIRWYLRRTSIGNAFVVMAAVCVSAFGSQEILESVIPIWAIILPPVGNWIVLTAFRRIFSILEPPIWDGAILHATEPAPRHIRPGVPDPMDVTKHLNRPTRRSQK